MGKVIARTGIKKRKGYLYYLDRNGDVAESKMAQHDDGSRHHSAAMDGTQSVSASRKPAITVAVEKTGDGLLLSAFAGNEYYVQRYEGYPIEEAKRMFRKYVQERHYGISGPEKAKPAKKAAPKKKATPKKASAKKAAPKKAAAKNAAPKKKYKTGLKRVFQTTRGLIMDKELKAKTPGRRVAASGRKYSERRSNRAD